MLLRPEMTGSIYLEQVLGIEPVGERVKPETSANKRDEAALSGNCRPPR